MERPAEFADKASLTEADFSEKSRYGGSSGQLRVVERFTRTDASTISYRVTVEDPGTWVTASTADVPFKATDEKMFEFACHEGNYSSPTRSGEPGPKRRRGVSRDVLTSDEIAELDRPTDDLVIDSLGYVVGLTFDRCAGASAGGCHRRLFGQPRDH